LQITAFIEKKNAGKEKFGIGEGRKQIFYKRAGEGKKPCQILSGKRRRNIVDSDFELLYSYFNERLTGRLRYESVFRIQADVFRFSLLLNALP
jgi:hypothetical protein